MNNLTLPMLMSRLENPTEFKNAILTFLKANGADVSINKVIADANFYHQQAVPAAAGVMRFFTAATPTSTSSNLTSFTRPESEHMIITGIRIMDGNNAVIQDTPWAYGSNLVPIKNAVLTVTVDGKIVLRNMPATMANPDLTDVEEGVISLIEPIFWQGQTDIEIAFEIFSGGAISDNLRLELIGVALIS